MKKAYRYLALVCASSLSFIGCIEENFENPGPAKDGDVIMFGARAGFENGNPDTRTVYTGETYEVNGVKFERIDWIDTPDNPEEGKWYDQIQIYSPDATNGPTAHYAIKHQSVAGEQNDYAYLSKISENALQWNGTGNHRFYAMYPSSNLFADNSTLAQGVRLNETILNGIIPGAQNPAEIIDDGNGNYVAVPDMRYAYMAAKGVSSPDKGNVSLTFVPIVTAVQIELQMPTSVSSGSGQVVPTTIAEIKVEGSGIAGAFTADLSEDAWKGTYPVCENASEGSGSIQIPVWRDNNPLTIGAGKTLTFTVFLRPGANVSDLKVLISPNGAAYVGQNIGIVFPAMKKTILNNVYLPATAVEIDASHWMSQLSGETALKKLSIPGTGGSFSYKYNSSNPDWYKQQTLTLDEQWAAGIRAFEIVSDRPSSASTTLGTQNVKCNKASMGVTVLDVLEDLLEKTASIPDGKTEPTECAVLILTYQPEGVSGNARNAVNYASSLKLMYDGLTEGQKNQIIQYKPDLTLADAKGKVMIFCRINQKDENDNGDTANDTAFELATNTLAGTNITLINGCGTGKDRWGSRGYKVNGNVAYDAANTSDSNKSVDYYLTQTGYAGNFSWPDWNLVTKPVAVNGDLNFAFGTNYSDVVCWYQEWARVVPESIIDLSTGWYHVKNTGLGLLDIYADYRWYESYKEKVAAAEETFKMAISDTYPSYVFINSLCGYLVDTSISDSYTIFTGSNTGGIAGNIKGLADKLNPAFYQYVLGAGLEQATGPTGIVMMDYVTNKPNTGVEYDGSYLLPGVIIANNFKFGTGNSTNKEENPEDSKDTDTENPGGNQGGTDGF